METLEAEISAMEPQRDNLLTLPNAHLPRCLKVQTSRADTNLHAAASGLTALKSFGQKDRQTLDARVAQLRSR
ncbi:hypothetical protein BTUL_0003g00530 [Botrytis tulipae]|uniref:Uncharacterized protein n=1 Tax=Botrytis tulipae TaxID=87230 RepID=A0A4Z1F845_9HELO|nr:hypothetical protein BTUL_0003g00530 [Botrytis tulipae]